MKRVEFEMFGETRLVPLRIMHNGQWTMGEGYSAAQWIERGEDWYGIDTRKRTLIVERRDWLTSPVIKPRMPANPTAIDGIVTALELAEKFMTSDDLDYAELPPETLAHRAHVLRFVDDAMEKFKAWRSEARSSGPRP